ncbi:MAG TPA: hypothetical protein VHH36_05390, partial [Candidatus Thermoplasmatota archaeon]|nr:hypothetical protein [Candidatus Thermoplasmatota archaeon]
MRLLLLPVAITLLAASLPLAAATHDPNPSGKQWAEATFTVAQPTLGDMDLAGAIILHKYTIGGTDYSSSDAIATWHASLPTQAAKDQFVADIENAVWVAMNTTLSAAFGADAVVARPVVDPATMVPSGGDAFDPGISIAVTAAIDRDPSKMGFGDLSAESIAVAFAAGAVVSSDFTLSAEPGYDMTYVIEPPADLAPVEFRNPASPRNDATVDAGRLRVHLNNSAGTRAVTEKVTFEIVDETAEASRPDAESIATAIRIQLGAPQAGVQSLPLNVSVTSQVAALDVAERFPEALPASVELPFLSADAVRALAKAGAITSADLDQAEADLKQTVKDNLASILPGATVRGGFDRADLAKGASAPYKTAPPVLFQVSTSGPYALPEGGENADLALRIGATLKFDMTLFRSEGGANEFTLVAPAGVHVVSAEGGQIAGDKASAVFRVPAGTGEAPTASVGIREAGARQYTKEDADKGATFGAVLDLQDVDVSIGKALGGDFGNLVGQVTVTAKMGVFEIPAEFKGSLPSNVELSYLTADGLRLLRQRDVVTQQMVDDLETSFRENVTAKLRDALGVPIEIQGGLAAGTLDPSKVGATPSGDDPVLLSASAGFVKPLSGAAPAPTAATALYSMPQTFKLPSVQGLATSYKVILPPGLAVTDVQVTDGASETGTEGGR